MMGLISCSFEYRHPVTYVSTYSGIVKRYILFGLVTFSTMATPHKKSNSRLPSSGDYRKRASYECEVLDILDMFPVVENIKNKTVCKSKLPHFLWRNKH